MHGRSIDRASLATTGALATARWGQREIKREAASRARGRSGQLYSNDHTIHTFFFLSQLEHPFARCGTTLILRRKLRRLWPRRPPLRPLPLRKHLLKPRPLLLKALS